MSKKYLDVRVISSLITQLQTIRQEIGNTNVEPIEDVFVLFDKLKNEDKDTEEKIAEAYGYIDKIIAKLDREKISQSMEGCETVYKRTIYWDSLDSLSQKYLCIADFLYSYLQETNKNDFSSAAIEFCRTLENELFLRIFKEFIINIIESYGDTVITMLVDDISKEKTKILAHRVIGGMVGQDLFLTLGQMQLCLYGLSRQDFSSSFVLRELRNFMLNNFKLDIALESEITLGLKDFTDKYRNKAVHPDILDIKCVKESKKAVICYLALINRYKSKSSEGQRASIGPSNKKIMPITLPSGTKWEDITIKFIDGHNVKIKCKGKAFDFDCKEMGFMDSKSRKPNKQWVLLQLLAKKHGKLSWEKSLPDTNVNIRRTEQEFGYESEEDGSASQNKGFSILKAPDKTKKTKQLLSQSLKAFFPIDGDPFFPYEEVKAYKIRIKLIG